MKDQLITVMEALRLAKAELRTHEGAAGEERAADNSASQRNSVRRQIDTSIALTRTGRRSTKRCSTSRGRPSQ